MPPPDKTCESQLRYFLRVLAALTNMNGGELRIPLKELRRIDSESSRQALIEDTDVQKDTLVLRFGTKHSAMYPVEPECLTPTQPKTQTGLPPVSPSPSQPPRRPLTDRDLAQAERKIRQLRMAAQLRQESRQQSASTVEELLKGNGAS